MFTHTKILCIHINLTLNELTVQPARLMKSLNTHTHTHKCALKNIKKNIKHIMVYLLLDYDKNPPGGGQSEGMKERMSRIQMLHLELYVFLFSALCIMTHSYHHHDT